MEGRAAARATTESVHFMLHADLVEEAIERALGVPDDDGAWPTLIGILFEAAELIPVELVIEEAARAGFRLHSFTRDLAAQPGGRRFYLVVLDKPGDE